MVVEDSAAMRGLIASVLSEIDGVGIVEMPNGFTALKVLSRESIDLFVLDINMPDINGLELLAFVRSNPRYASTPIVIVTTEGASEDRRRGISLGASAYLTKPFRSEDLLATVRNLLGATP